MNEEQMDFFDKLDQAKKEGDSKFQNDLNTKKEEVPVFGKQKGLYPKDNLDFDCETCQDRPGGCSQCGFGKNR